MSVRVDVELGYGFGMPCEHGGYQFGIWEFCKGLAHMGIPEQIALSATYVALERLRWSQGRTKLQVCRTWTHPRHCPNPGGSLTSAFPPSDRTTAYRHFYGKLTRTSLMPVVR
jgi:hypothetical protein